MPDAAEHSEQVTMSELWTAFKEAHVQESEPISESVVDRLQEYGTAMRSQLGSGARPSARAAAAALRRERAVMALV